MVHKKQQLSEIKQQFDCSFCYVVSADENDDGNARCYYWNHFEATDLQKWGTTELSVSLFLFVLPHTVTKKSKDFSEV